VSDQQVQDLIAAVQQLHADNQVLQTLAATQVGYIMHLHQVCTWLAFLSLIFGFCLIAMLRPRGA